MAAKPHIVSFWTDPAASEFTCSGVLIAPYYILTVAHAFEGLAMGDESHVGLLPGKHGAVPAKLFARHPELDAALFSLDEHMEVGHLPLPEDIGGYKGRMATLHAIDPDSHHVATLNSHSIGSYADKDREYVLAPQSALGYSGGVVAVGEQIIALLNRRATGGDPIARAIALSVLRPWIAWAIDSKPGGRGYANKAEDYDNLEALLGHRTLRLLANDGTADLRRIGSFPENLGATVGRSPKECFQPLVVDLYKSTERCLPAWKGEQDALRVKQDCHALLGELIKLAVDKDRPREELAEIAAATPDRMFVACKHTGTAAAVYCALKEFPLRLASRKPGDRDIGGGCVIDLDGLAQGVGADAERDAYQAVWLSAKGAPIPKDFSNDDYVDILQDAIDMERTAFRGDPLFIAVRGPREWLHEGGLATASARLTIGLVIHDAESDYAYLAVTERRLINLVCKYLQLLESL